MAKYLSKRQPNLNLGISSYTESNTVLQTIGKVGIGTTNAGSYSLYVVGTTNITGDINVGGASTFVGVGTFGNDLYVANQLYVGGVNVSGGSSIGEDITTRNFLATGISTFNGFVDANGGLDVTGHTELDNVNVSGVATIASLAVQSNFNVYDTQAVFHNDLFIAGNLSIGGTTTVLIAEDLFIIDKTIVLGIATNSLNVDIANDDSANGGGISIASTEGNPLVSLQAVGVNSLPNTHKKILWSKANTYGIGTTDAWMFNYAVGIGSTLVPNGVRFAVSEIQFTDDTINTPNINVAQNLNISGTSTLGIASASQLYVSGLSTFVGLGTFQNDLYIGGDLYVKDDLVIDELTSRNLNVTGLTTVGVVNAISVNASGIITANSFRPSSGYIQAADGTNSFFIYNGSGNVAFQGTIGASSINNGQGYQAINFTTTSTPTVLIPNDLNVTGLTTLSSAGGITTTGGDLYVGGDLYIKDDLFFDEFTARNATVTGNTTLGFTTTGQLYVKGLEVAGVATFRGNAYFGDTDVLNFGDSNDLQVFHDGSNSYLRETGVGSLILASDGVGVDVYNVSQGEYQARFINNGAVELYHNNVKRLETTGYGITVYNTIQAPQINITGIGTIDGVRIASGIVTSSNPGVTTIKYYGDGSNLFGVNAFNVVNQLLASSPVYPTFANNIGVTSIGIADTEVGYVPASGNLGIGSTNPTAKLQVVGDVIISGITTLGSGATTTQTLFTNQLSVSGVSTFIGVTTHKSTFFGNQLSVSGVSTLATLHAPKLTYDGSDFGGSEYLAKADGAGGWTWAEVPGIFSVNNILNGFVVKDEGSVVGTAGSITTIDFIGNNIIATADPQPNGIATVRLSNTPTFDSLVVNTGITTLGVTTATSLFSNQLSVSGLSTFIGVGTFNSDLYVGGNLYVNNDLVFDEFTARNINVTGVSTLGTASATTLFVSGISTFNNVVNIGSAITAYPATGIISATAFYGDGSNLANTGSTLNASSGTQRLVLTSQTTGTMTQSATNSDLVYDSSTNTLSGTNFAPTQLSVSGVSTFTGAISTGTTTGFYGQYLQSTGIGVSWATFPTLRTTQTSVATNGQTTFSFAYNINFLDVFVNGVKLTSSEYTATDGITIILSSPAFNNDIVEFVSYNTTSVGGGGGGGASVLNDLSDVNLSLPAAAGENLTYNGSNWVNDYTVTASTSTTSQTAIYSLSSSTYRSIEYTIQATQGLKYHLTKLLVIHDGLIASSTEYGTIFTIDSLGIFDVDISGGNIRLLVTPSAAITTNYKIKFTAIKV